MRESQKLIRAVINGQPPDRAPMFDLLRNTTVIECFTDEKLMVANRKRLHE
jgi:hypothetical protein